MFNKFLGTTSIIIGSITLGYVFALSWLLGHAAGNFGGGRKAGEPGRVKSIIIPLGKWKLHLHHWLCSLGLIGISSASGIYFLNPNVTYGLLGGLAFQGIYSYTDWYKIVKSRLEVDDI